MNSDEIDACFLFGRDAPENAECPHHPATLDAHWWTRGFAYTARLRRAMIAESEIELLRTYLQHAQNALQHAQNACTEAMKSERDACSIVVWLTLQDALADGADDIGLDGWMREAERRVKSRHEGP